MEGFIDSVAADHFYIVRTDKGYIGTAAVVAYSAVVKFNGQRVDVNWRNVTIRTGVGASTILAFMRSLKFSLSSFSRLPRH